MPVPTRFLRKDEADVVGQGVSPGTDEDETEFGGAGHEKKLGPFTLKFEVRESFFRHRGPKEKCPTLRDLREALIVVKVKIPTLRKPRRMGHPSRRTADPRFARNDKSSQ